VTADARPPHGIKAYKRGCRCDECKAAGVEYRRAWAEAHPGYATEAVRRWRRADPERSSRYGTEYSRKWRAANPERDAAARRAWRAANPGREAASIREYYAANPDAAQRDRERRRLKDQRRHLAMSEEEREKKRAYVRKWAKVLNPEKARALQMAKRARKLNAFVEYVEAATVYERDNWICHICGEKIDRRRVYPDPFSPSVDHVIPLAKGGTHEYANCATSHLVCNVSKGKKILATDIPPPPAGDSAQHDESLPLPDALN
jgi:5-methylcytosine-specific restriction endonuclease McrA